MPVGYLWQWEHQCLGREGKRLFPGINSQLFKTWNMTSEERGSPIHLLLHEAVQFLLEPMLQCSVTVHSAMRVHCMPNMFQWSITVSSCSAFPFVSNSDCSISVWWVDPVWIPGVHQSQSMASLHWTDGEKYNKGVEIRARRDHAQLPSWATQTRLGETGLMYNQIKYYLIHYSNQSNIIRNYLKTHKYLTPSWAQLHSWILYLLHLISSGSEECELQFHASHILSAAACSSHSSPAPKWSPSLFTNFSHGRRPINCLFYFFFQFCTCGYAFRHILTN